MTHLSKTFLKTLHETTEKHLDDPDLDVKKLTRLLGMSRTDLHRKITVYAGMSITAYVRKILAGFSLQTESLIITSLTCVIKR